MCARLRGRALLWRTGLHPPRSACLSKTKRAGSGSASGSGSISQRYGSADSDPYQYVADPEHCYKELASFHYLQGFLKAMKLQGGGGRRVCARMRGRALLWRTGLHPPRSAGRSAPRSPSAGSTQCRLSNTGREPYSHNIKLVR